ncbi:GntR family transcriptional regulator [Actinokineospora sp. PR83]|uniref:GntR family transcriptional regulator n=1 Tax=Actinokineospora sp. PR83 TaxID=2884908 RepID=UPI0027DEDE1E|nr:GntR family transcriptional regulator [Actinokineospora sp. PR83]MCG8915391.1 GntR family transcriptional regulator [Actinokineospora sp. PR83]
MTTNPSSPQGEPPASRRVAAALRALIESGELSPGDVLPSERGLSEQFGVARNTAREAVRLLADEGLVIAKHGKGVFVREEPRLLRFGSERYSQKIREETGLSPYRAEVSKQGRTARVDCTSITRVPAPALVAERLFLPTESEVARRENWYYADDEPVQCGVTYIPWHIAQGSVLGDSANLGPGSLYARFDELGYPIKVIREEISARMPRISEKEALKIPDGVPVIEVIHTGINHEGTPFEVTIFTMRADTNGLDYTIPVED